MSRRDAAGLSMLIGVTALAVGLTERLTRFLRPSMGLWLTCAGGAALVLGAWVFVVDVRAGRHAVDATSEVDDISDRGGIERRWASRAGWFLLIPFLVLTVVDPGALGSYAVGQKGIYRAPPQEVDLGDMVAARSFNDQAVEVSLLDLWNGLGDEGNRRAVSEVRLRVKGLVVNEGGGEDGFLLARLVMGCCAADALPVAMMIRHDLQVTLPDDAWVVVEGVLDPEATARALADDESWPVLAGVMDLVSYELIDEPPDPYLYPW